MNAKRSILLVGAGRMGSALLKGWIAKNLGPLLVVEPSPSAALEQLAHAKKLELYALIEEVAPRRLSACVVAIKPQILKTEAQRLKPIADAGALIVSIAAGASIKTLARACGSKARVVRAMPNLPGAIGKGITALYAPRRARPVDRATAELLLGALGKVVWVANEPLIDAVTAVSGSGPAYVFLLAEALAQAARAEGLPKGLAETLARATVSGAGALLEADRRSPGALRRDVTSPKGTTEAALNILMANDALAALVARAVAAARRRADELGS